MKPVCCTGCCVLLHQHPLACCTGCCVLLHQHPLACCTGCRCSAGADAWTRWQRALPRAKGRLFDPYPRHPCRTVHAPLATRTCLQLSQLYMVCECACVRPMEGAFVRHGNRHGKLHSSLSYRHLILEADRVVVGPARLIHSLQRSPRRRLGSGADGCIESRPCGKSHEGVAVAVQRANSWYGSAVQTPRKHLDSPRGLKLTPTSSAILLCLTSPFTEAAANVLKQHRKHSRGYSCLQMVR